MTGTPKNQSEQGHNAPNPLYILFAAAFLVQVGLQQFFVRLSPYLFALNISGGVESTLVRLGTVSVDMSAVTGVAALVIGGARYLRGGLKDMALGVSPLVVGLLVLIMDTARVILPSSGFSSLYGSSLWFILTVGVLLFFTSTAFGAFAATLRSGGHRLLEYAGTLLLTLTAAVMGVYYIYTRLQPAPSLYVVTISYNLTINMLGVGVALYALTAFFRLGRKGRWFSLGLTSAASAGVAYVFYGGLFSDKILELTWQTSFGTPLPLPQSVGYAFFLLLLFFCVIAGCASHRCDPMLLVATIILASSVFLANSLLVYTQAAALACLMLLERFWIGGPKTHLASVHGNSIRNKSYT